MAPRRFQRRCPVLCSDCSRSPRLRRNTRRFPVTCTKWLFAREGGRWQDAGMFDPPPLCSTPCRYDNDYPVLLKGVGAPSFWSGSVWTNSNTMPAKRCGTNAVDPALVHVRMRSGCVMEHMQMTICADLSDGVITKSRCPDRCRRARGPMAALCASAATAARGPWGNRGPWDC